MVVIRWSLMALCGILVWVVSSCGHAPRMLAEEYRSIHIPVVHNETLQYGIEEPLTHALVEEFQRESSLSVQPSSSADLTLITRITQAETTPSIYSDISRAVGYTMTMTVFAKAVDSSGKVVMEERPFHVSGQFILQNEPGLTTIEDLPYKLASQIRSHLVEGW